MDVALKHTASYNPDCKVYNRSSFLHDPEKVRSLGEGAEVSLALDTVSRISSAHHIVVHSPHVEWVVPSSYQIL